MAALIPVRWFGFLIHWGERRLRPICRGAKSETLAGAILTSSVASIGFSMGRPKNAVLASVPRVDRARYPIFTRRSSRRNPRSRTPVTWF